MCSYMAMFPPNLPHYFIEKCTQTGDVVLDPFCGRGTTPLEACLMGRAAVGNDLNCLAYTLNSDRQLDLGDQARLSREVSPSGGR